MYFVIFYRIASFPIINLVARQFQAQTMNVHDLALKGQTNPLEEEIKKNPGRVDEQNSVSA